MGLLGRYSTFSSISARRSATANVNRVGAGGRKEAIALADAVARP